MSTQGFQLNFSFKPPLDAFSLKTSGNACFWHNNCHYYKLQSTTSQKNTYWARLNQRIKNRFSAELCCAICPLSSCSSWFSLSQEETTKMDIKILRNKLPFSLSLHTSLPCPYIRLPYLPSLTLSFPSSFSPPFSTLFLFHSCTTVTAAIGKQCKYQAWGGFK